MSRRARKTSHTSNGSIKQVRQFGRAIVIEGIGLLLLALLIGLPVIKNKTTQIENQSGRNTVLDRGIQKVMLAIGFSPTPTHFNGN